MKRSLIVLFIAALFFRTGQVRAQENEVLNRMKEFHQYMVRDEFLVDLYIDDSLSYGHSNGWVENWKQFRENLGTRLVYHSITEDSIEIKIHGNYAHVRFNGDFDVTLDGKRAVYQLKVLQVWIRHGKKKNWDLFARQAVKRQ